ncbi:MAG TPA: glycogen synthase GlgA [Bradyrhizobium sp.]|uniref:glycogen synthase GlgA n=1 Tax=Bradyrhizobium sp. TaxID=376 RepID=UPI002B932C2F|nr:glycogen synthase GlgA [Bradyrhizobium sp.]HLZ01083.1 glycogen synthase GlgA [Bradyrhizobium sp.]
MRVLFASAEAYPIVKTGGLGDVSGALPRALRELGVDVRLILPAYRRALSALADKSVMAQIPSRNGAIHLISGRMPDSGVPVWLVGAPALYDRPGGPYRDETGREWPDNAQRFAAFCHVAASLARGELVSDWQADVVHANDWHTGLLALLLAKQPGHRPATVFTIHNLAYQGLFPRSVLPLIDISDDLFSSGGVEFYGNVSFLKAGIQFSDRITTVSPSYAREIMTPDYGCGLDGLLRHRANDLSGILNGVDYDVWNPSHDEHLAANFTADDLSGKCTCKLALQHELGLTVDPDRPLIAWLSRITDQKMAAVVYHALHMVLERDVQLALLGEGDPILEAKLQDAAQHYKGRLSVRIGYEEPLAHRLQAGADLLLHPSRFEPCGLTPLYAMHYGTLPIVRHVGGLSDTIVDATEWTIRGGSATGFAFREATTSAMLGCLDRAIAFYARPTRWRKMQQRAMSRRFDWSDSARRYFAIYRKIAPNAAATEFERDTPPSASHHGSVLETRHQHEQRGKAGTDNVLPLSRQAG